MACEICGAKVEVEGDDICESCMEEWEESEALAIEAELKAEQAYLAHLELPSMNEPIDEYEAAMKGMF